MKVNLNFDIYEFSQCKKRANKKRIVKLFLFDFDIIKLTFEKNIIGIE